MKNRHIIALTVVMVLLLMPIFAFADEDVFDIPYNMHKLKNGLTLIHHEDNKAPIVAVNIWYHVGSKNEKFGKTGFAHLFEHLMFNGSENHDDDYFQVLNPLGATSMNGTTDFDRTNYFQNVPKNAIDVVLWMESDRMGHLLGAISQEKLDEQREVVKNEKRQGDNQPYGTVFYSLFENVFPQGHPYHHMVIGSMDDLNAASLDDVHEWFKNYYGPNNAVIVVAGDIDFETAKQKVELYFGDIPPGPPVAQMEQWVPRWNNARRETMQDRAPLPRFHIIWPMPAWGTVESDRLALVSDLLSSGKSSRLYKRLVYDEQLCLFAQSVTFPLEISGLFGVIAVPRPGVTLEKVEAVIREEVERFLKEGPTEEELERVRTQRIASFLRGAETIGGFSGKSSILASNFIYGGTPDYYKKTLEHYRGATVENLREAANEWLGKGEYVLNVTPFPQNLAAAEKGADRSALPETGEPPAATFPTFTETTLDNGLRVIVAERHAVPVVQFNLAFDAGYAADSMSAPGTASMTLSMLDEGTDSLDALKISDKQQLLGMYFYTFSNLDQSVITMSALKMNLDESMALYADLVLNPAFPERNLGRVKGEFMGSIRQEQAQPNSMALRVLPKLLYGEGHAYSTPLTGSGTMESIQAMTSDALSTFHQTWFKPNNAVLVVVGDTTAEEIMPKIQQHFGSWEQGDVPIKQLAQVQDPSESTVYIMDRPGAAQSVIFAGKLIVPNSDPNDTAIDVMNGALGGDFNARINMNLREDKGWSYGASMSIIDAVGQRPYFVVAPVQSDKTVESMSEIMKELRGVTGDNPISADELERVHKSMTLTVPGSLETAGAVARNILNMVRFNYPDDYFATYVQRIRGISLDQVGNAAAMTIDPDRMIWVVVGDRSKIEDGIRELGFGNIVPIDAQGNVVQ